MVGVPGRSKGCRHCREKRKRCNLQKPSCKRCQQHGVNCDYSRPMVFMNSSQENMGGAEETTTVSVGDEGWSNAGEGNVPLREATDPHSAYAAGPLMPQPSGEVSRNVLPTHATPDGVLKPSSAFRATPMSEDGVRIDPRWKLLFLAIINRKKRSAPMNEAPLQNYAKGLLDILMDMPELLEDLDAVRRATTLEQYCTRHRQHRQHGSSSRWQQLYNELTQKCQYYDKKLVSWVRSLSPSTSKSPELFGMSYQPPMAVPVTPEQLAYAHSLSLYWVACLLLSSTLELASQAGSILGRPAEPEPSSAGGGSKSWRDSVYSNFSGLGDRSKWYIRHIIKATPVLMNSGPSGQEMAVLPLGLALLFAAVDGLDGMQTLLLGSANANANDPFIADLICCILDNRIRPPHNLLAELADWVRRWVQGLVPPRHKLGVLPSSSRR